MQKSRKYRGKKFRYSYLITDVVSNFALHICRMILTVLWDGRLARPLYFGAGKIPTPQDSSLDSVTPVIYAKY